MRTQTDRPQQHARILFLLLGVAILLLALSAGLTAQAASSDPDRRGYVVGPQDVLAITVWGEENLSGRFPVAEDGTFLFPLAGRITAAGRTVTDIETELRAGLTKRYLKNPQISVSVDQYRSQQIHVMGEVQHPGSYPLTGPMSLIEALARAGSLTPRAGAEALIVRSADAATGPVRPEDKTAGDVIRIPIEQLQRGDLSRNVALRAGDTIFVPRGETVFVFGQVNKPGEYVLQPGTTVMQVISLAGGLTERGSTRGLRLVRRGNGQSKELKVKLGDVVQPGDTLVVGERIF